MEQTFSASQYLGEFDGGVLDAKATRILSSTALAVLDTGKSGKVTIEIVMKPTKDSRSQINTQITAKQSKPTKRGKSTEEDTTGEQQFVSPKGAISSVPWKQDDLFKPKTKQETDSNVD